jgi:hypothetical protein
VGLRVRLGTKRFYTKNSGSSNEELHKFAGNSTPPPPAKRKEAGHYSGLFQHTVKNFCGFAPPTTRKE